ncbi:hypothetical protein K5I29_10035 [Flavobacterium agricola]|uniref:Rieske domain-containing protein n=1 Tax=Flavobacterium agricola TaxID=2870839 RepID=A0ABY6LX95_9FLAO|nr:hypothetical protein [Flavobacterium agricola]UYW00839.1 hypothetical protein K5I29_10035 [Flavobacterium agricola]
MKNLLFLVVALVTLASCSKDDNIKNKNPYLPNYPINISLNLDLPANVDLQYVSNYKYVNTPGAGIKGIFVFNNGNGYIAFDAACPNMYPNECEPMKVEGVKAVCACDDSSYSLFTGLGDMQYSMKQYRTELVGSMLRIYN